MIGKAKHIFRMLNLVASSTPIEQDPNWWKIRAWVIATDRDRATNEISANDRLAMRIN